ncbi:MULTISPECIES: hypothetical protein [unclassified Cryobacterium]|uniref:hypothetical protein n=1 Tax=unclassified Cryobacterium TaxID=2649013 RepID=UPI0010693E0A|nr:MULTISPECIES: hypothetical protein [unclassified Cryobacterium]TFC59418.1 hypothetical protein E3O68_00520 [Cryobacterium sp. TMB3-1-2]TFC67214.1 hypothetical protein E3T21_17215 [Cryobacterium sp. TMB3-15]TFC73273.1 hypothetical protein E3T22_16840 [Cryobacterium sp. TMB3-10]TFD46161.1 hypothetical protein E3T58_01475 [Cryobacterium sp. TMB3-12]
MSHAYKSLEDGQVVVSEEPRKDLEALARWESIDVPEEKKLTAAEKRAAKAEAEEAAAAAELEAAGVAAADAEAAAQAALELAAAGEK